ncbi:hypothetical protein ATJ97_1403 [Georgenia soli]|uniref:Uncharacterized protein n=1 Tax=Georgenia soli TaxID=638953 RepID=A0A2A9EKX5_9MICO|nr:hypothetical protein [Georgenia soli]PFG38912.1 hypothetical protein ATJ97_1403 [Georgenia soli]
MTVDSQHRATGPRQGDEPTRDIHRDGHPTEELPGDRETERDDALGEHEVPSPDRSGYDDDVHEAGEEPAKGGSDRPSGVQVTASALAAVTATALLSTLGVAGTLIGAALSSIVTVFANYLYSSSLRRTAERVATAPPVQKVRARTRVGTTAVLQVPADGGAADGRPTSTVALASAQAVTGGVGTEPAEAGHTADAGATAAGDAAGDAAGGRLARLRAAWQAVVDRYGRRRIIVTVLAFFAAVLAAVTLIELAAGKPLANVVRNEDGAGTSLFGGGSATDTTGTTDQGENAGNDPVPGTDREGTAPDRTTDETGSNTGDQQPGDSGETPAPTPTSDATPGEDTDGATPSPSPTPPGSVTPEQPPVPDYQAPGDQAPGSGTGQQGTSEVPPQIVPEPAPAE